MTKPKAHKRAACKNCRGENGMRYRRAVQVVHAFCTAGTEPLYWLYRAFVLVVQACCTAVRMRTSGLSACALHCFAVPGVSGCPIGAKPSNCKVNCCILLYVFRLQGIRPARFWFPRREYCFPSMGIFVSQYGNYFPLRTGKAAALPVAKHIETLSEDLYLLGGHRYWCSETSGRSRKYGHKKCPESLLGRLSPPPEQTALYVFRDGKSMKNPRNFQTFRGFFSFNMVFFHDFQQFLLSDDPDFASLAGKIFYFLHLRRACPGSNNDDVCLLG